MRDLETHGYAAKSVRRGRPEYSQAVDSPSLPAVCAHCGRDFKIKNCKITPKTERQRETDTQTQEEGRKPRKSHKKRMTNAAAAIAQAIREESHDAA